MVVIPYVEGESEKIARIMKSYSISTVMKPHTTLRNLLVHPKDIRDPHNSAHDPSLIEPLLSLVTFY